MKKTLCALAGAGIVAASVLASGVAQAADTIKVGILHSLSGTMAISETTLKDVMLMLIEDQNAKGGLLGKKLEAVVVDPASNWPLFAEKARELLEKGQGRRRVRLLDLGFAQIGPARVRGTQRHAVLPRSVRGRGKLPERVLYGRRAEPAGHSGGRIPDERGRWQRGALGPARDRLRLPAHHEQDPAGVPELQGRLRRRHHGELHAVRALRLADHRRRRQEIRVRRQEDGRGLHHQRRRQCAVLQGTGQPGHQRRGHPGRRVLRRRGRTRGSGYRSAGGPSRRVELLHERGHAGKRRVHQEVARLHQG